MDAPTPLGADVIMRRWEPSDAAGCLATVDAERSRLARWMPWVPFATTVSDFAAYIERAAEQEREGTGCHRGLFEGPVVVGSVGASVGALNFDESDVGYWLSSAHEGKGLVTTAMRHLLDWLFVERDMHRITIRAAVGNVRSRAVAERLGFTYEGILRGSLLLGDDHADAALYSLLGPEWGGAGTA
jgi:ribosomal-protein-serine acetyltransferase